MTFIRDPSARALAHLRMIRDELEQIGRPEGGEVFTVTQQQLDAMIDDADVAARAIREREERAS